MATTELECVPSVDGTLAVAVNRRIECLRVDVMSRNGSWPTAPNPFTRDVALWRAWVPGRSVVQARAALLLELVGLAPIEVRPDWHLAGEHLAGHAFGLTSETCEDEAGLLNEFGLSACEIAELRDAGVRWRQGREHCAAVGEAEDDPSLVRSIYWANGWIENHSIRDYAKVLAVGFEGIREEIEHAMASARLDAPDYPGKENFWKAGLRVCEAGVCLGRRYADEAESMVSEAVGQDDFERLTRMAQACRQVPARGACTLFEATQSLWLAHILTCGEDGINANSIGRLDQILHPYYQADLEAGRITRDEAVELMEELACKLYLDYDVQAITLGGQDDQGDDATNETSLIILEATDKVGFVRDVSVRLSSASPERLVTKSAELVARGGGIPFIFNDDCFIPALSDRGIALEDARNYAPIGCIELTVPGRANPHAVSGWFNAAKCLELALFDGVDPCTGAQLGPRTGLLNDLGSYEALYDAYCSQVSFFAERMVYHCNRGELAQREWGPLPCWSVLTDDCIARGRDITDGGAVYNYHSVCFLGTANTADALCAMKRLVYEEHRVDAGELLAALRVDFDGHEPLRKRLLTAAPKYGNDMAEVDAIAARVANDFIDLMDRAGSPLGGRYFVHLFTFLCNIDFGAGTGATPDGRRAGEPLAYSLSAHQGRDTEGVTAMLQSLARLPHERAAGATAAIIDLDPQMVAGDTGVDRLAQLIGTAVAMKVGQLQFNVTTVERLRKAQEDPERYGNIPVRVAGYSQKFNLLTKALQDHVMARTKHTR
jgi:trans-4-hydroxy-L-proline dehydratase